MTQETFVMSARHAKTTNKGSLFALMNVIGQ